jgi:hypothetical protein
VWTGPFRGRWGKGVNLPRGPSLRGAPKFSKYGTFFNINNGKFYRFWLKKSVLPMFYPEFAREKIFEP